jgi:hypothetical protein
MAEKDFRVKKGLVVDGGNIAVNGDNRTLTFDDGDKIVGDHSSDGLQIRTQDTDPIVFKTNGNNIRMSIEGDGKIGIGTPSPVSLLHLHQNAYDFDDGVQDEDGDLHLMLKSGQNSNAGDAISIGFAQSSTSDVVGAKISHVIEDTFSRGSLVFSTNNSTSGGDSTAERMRITGAGKVGINNDSPTATLDVTIVGSNTTTSGIAFGDSAGKGYLAAGSSYVSFATDDGTTRIAIDNGGTNLGNVGIGTTSPGKTLHVSDGSTSGITGGTNAALLITDNANPRIYFEDVSEGSGDRVMDIMYENEYLSFNSLNDTASAYDTQNIMVVHRDGKVGIGTSDPDFTLDVTGTFQAQGDHDGNVIIDNTGSAQTILASHTGSGTPVPFDIRGASSANSNNAAYGVLTLTRTNISADGAGANLHFRTKTFDGSVQEVGGIGATIDTGLTASATRKGSLRFYTTDAGSNRQEKMTIASDGKVGIGNTDPSSILHVKEASTINSVANSSRLIVGGSGGDSYIHLMESTDGHNIRHTASDNSLRFRSTLAGSDLMTLTSGGNLGIGTTTVNGKLHVRDTSDGSDQYSGIRFYPADSETSSTDPDFYHIITGFRKGGLMLTGGQDGNHTRTYATLNNDGFKVFTNAGDNTAVNMSTQQRLLIPTGGGSATLSVGLDVTGTVSATAFSGEVQPKATTQAAGNNTANYYAKLVTFNPGGSTVRDCNLILGVTTHDQGAVGSAIISVKFRSNGATQEYTADVAFMSKTGNSVFDEDAFQIFSDGNSNNSNNTDIELWVKKSSSYSALEVHEISKAITGGTTTLTYHTNSAWQSSAPTNNTFTTTTQGIELNLDVVRMGVSGQPTYLYLNPDSSSVNSYIYAHQSGDVSVLADDDLTLHADSDIFLQTGGGNTRVTIDSSGDVSMTGSLTVSGDLTVNGTNTVLNTDELQVEDNVITLNYHPTGDTSGSANGSGIIIQDAVDSSTDASITWDATNDEFDFSHSVTITGSLSATTKSFDIEHPTKKGMRLHHGSLEGPEHGVYFRGRLEGDTIELPDYWLGLVDEDTITVQLTPNRGFQQIYVDHIEDNKVYVGTQTDTPIDCFYLIHAERKDVGKMEVEY